MLSVIQMPVGHFLLATKKNIPNEKELRNLRSSFAIHARV
jgi:hypothetical protein